MNKIDVEVHTNNCYYISLSLQIKISNILL